MTWLIVAVALLALHAVWMHVRVSTIISCLTALNRALAKWPGWQDGWKRHRDPHR